MQFDITKPGALKKISEQISSDIDDFCKETLSGGFRNHLGASLIGKKCSRLLWYSFRWTFKEDFSPRMLRLFQRGHREEEIVIAYLEGIGCKLYSHDYTQPPNEKGEYPQFRISAVNGHFGGSLDGVIELPEKYGIPGRFLFECKTSTTGSPFNKLCSSGVQIEKPVHFAQMSTYSSDPNFNFEYALYIAVNKNDDSLHIEMVKIDHSVGERMVDKASRIIASDVAPPRISNKETHYECVMCGAHQLCHKGAVPEKNCRSCKYATPIENAEWGCRKYSMIIPEEHIRSGCGEWFPITTVD